MRMPLMSWRKRVFLKHMILANLAAWIVTAAYILLLVWGMVRI